MKNKMTKKNLKHLTNKQKPNTHKRWTNPSFHFQLFPQRDETKTQNNDKRIFENPALYYQKRERKTPKKDHTFEQLGKTKEKSN